MRNCSPCCNQWSLFFFHFLQSENTFPRIRSVSAEKHVAVLHICISALKITFSDASDIILSLILRDMCDIVDGIPRKLTDVKATFRHDWEVN